VSAAEVGRRFRAAVEARDLDGVAALLDPGVRLQSPIAFQPFEGREAAREVLAHVLEVFEDFHYVDELEGAETHALLFRAHIGGRQLEGLDHLLVPATGGGLVTVFTVMVRPLSGALALAEQMAGRVGHLKG
jgi:hypothetical protein